MSVAGIGGMEATFGYGTNPGLVLTSGQLTSLDMSVTTAFTVLGVTVASNNLHLTYAAASGSTPASFGLVGSTTVSTADMALALDVTFGNGSTPGLVISGGALSSLDMTVMGSFTVDSVAFAANNIELDYAAATLTSSALWSLTGGATATTADSQTSLGVTFGYGSTPGLVITGGELTSLDMTVSTSFSVDNVSFAANDLEFMYTAASGTNPAVFAMSGSTTVSSADGRLSLDVDFGYRSSPGLVVTGGDLTSLDLTVTGTLSVDSVAIEATDVQFTYTAAAGAQPAIFTLAGTAVATIGGMGSLSVTFGHTDQTTNTTTPGLVIASGDLSSLDMTVSGGFTVGGVGFTATDLQFTDTAGATPADDVFALTGTASATVAGMGSLSLTFGHDGSPGLVVTGGELTSLDLTVNGQFKVSKVTFAATELQLEYVASSSTYSMAGTAALTVGAMNDLSVTFGYTDQSSGATVPGLVITSTGGTASLQSLDMTVDAQFQVAQVTFEATDLQLTYAASTGSFSVSGSAALDVAHIGNLNVTFGHIDSATGLVTPGLVIASGNLVSLDMTVDSSMSVGSVSLATTGLELTYTAGTSAFTLAGSASADVVGIGNLGITFGNGSSPGLVISNGILVSLNTTVNSDIEVGGTTFQTIGLEFSYVASTSSFSLFGRAEIDVNGIGNLSATFGHGASPGLVITSGALTSLDMTVDSNIKVGGVSFTTTGLEFTYVKSTAAFTLAGSADVSVTGIGNLSITFGQGSSPGLVITSGVLVSLNATVDSNINVGAVMLTTTGLEFIYAASTSTFTLAGSAGASVSGIGNLTVTFGHGSNSGLVITNGSLVSLDMTVDSDIEVSGVTIKTTGLEFTYVASTSAFSLLGQAEIDVNKVGNLSATFGHGASPGLVISNGVLASLDMTVDSNINVGGVSFTTTGLEFTYVKSTAAFTLAGSAGVSVTGIGNLSVTFGHGSSPGLVVSSGALVSLDMTVDSNISMGGVTFKTAGLEFTYVTSIATFTLAGSAGVSVAGIGNLNLTFGHGSNPGLVVTGGALVSLDMTVDSNIKVGAVTFQTTGLEFTYVTSTATFTLAGSAGLSVAGIGNLTVTFGHGSNPGLVVTNGALVSLDMTVDSDINVGAVTIKTTGLEFTYVTSTATFTLAGSAGLSVAGIGNLTVTFGHGSSPGLVIINGALASLDMTVDSNISVGSVTFQTTGLEFTYVTSTATFTLAGSAGLSVAGIGSLTVTFGHGSSPGLVITNGALVSLDMTVDSSITVGSVTFQTTGLEFTYVTSTATFTLAGSASVSVTGIANLMVTFGHGSNPGLVITNGALVSLDMTVNSDIHVGPVTISTNDLEFTYVTETSTFTLAGTASLDIAKIGDVSVTFGHGTSPGLVIENGELVSLDLTVNGSFTVDAALTFSITNMEMTYVASTDTFTMTGDASVNVLGIGSVVVHLGGGSTKGLVVVDGQLETLNMTVDANFSAGPLALNGTLVMSYAAGQYVNGQYEPSEFVMTGDASASIFGLNVFDVDLGGQGTQGLVIVGGQLESLNLSIDTGIDLGFVSATLEVTASWTASTGTFTFDGQATVSLNFSDLPSWVQTFVGSSNFSVSVGLYLNVVAGDKHDSYVDVYTTIDGETVGLKIAFDGTVSIELGDPFQALVHGIEVFAHDVSEAYTETAQAMSVAYRAAANGITDAYNITAAALDQAYNEAGSAVQTAVNAVINGVTSAANDIGNALSTVGNDIDQAANTVSNFFSSWFDPLTPIAGATGYYDAGLNFDYGSDPSVITASDGSFPKLTPDTATSGQLVLVGGTDIATRLPNTLILTAPYDATVVTTLTTLVNQVMQQQSVSEATANAEVAGALGLPTSLGLTTQNFVAAAMGGDLVSAQAYAAEVKVASIAKLLTGWLSSYSARRASSF